MAEQPRQSLVEDFTATLGEGIEGAAAAAALEGHLRELEAAFSEIASSHSRVYWLHLARRMPPQPVEGQWPEWSSILARRVLTLGILKYGAASSEGEFVLRKGELGSTRVPQNVEDEDLIALYRLDLLSVSYAHAAAAYRRVGKGAKLVPEEAGFVAAADRELEDLLRSVDERHSRYGGIAAGYGSAVDFEIGDEEQLPIGAILYPSFNFDQEDPSPLERLLDVKLSEPTNYVPGFLELGEYRDYLIKFEEEVLKETGANPDEILATLWAASMNLMLGIEVGPLQLLQVLNTGYESIPERSREDMLQSLSVHVAAWLREIREEEVDREEAVEATRRGFAAWTYQAEDLSSISLWDRLPFKLAIPDEDAVLFDYSSIPEGLSGLARSVGFLAGEAGNVKARDFEDKVEERAREAGFPAWEVKKELINSEGAKRELDVGIVVGGTLFVVECKAFAQNPRIDRGDFAALKSRRETLEGYLDQARTLADFLREERKGRNYEVPEEVVNFEHMLCTPGVEYVWSRDQRLWLSDEIPRICTPTELIEHFKHQGS